MNKFPRIEAASLRSKIRPSKLNEDAIAYAVIDFRESDKEESVAVICVADGMTTLETPHLASSYAVHTAMATFFTSQLPLQERPSQMVVEANNCLLNHASKKNFGTTLTTVVATGNIVHIGSIGDSRVYHVSNSTIQCLTQDHSRLAEHLGRNPSRVEIKTSAKSKKLGRSLGEKVFCADYVFATEYSIKEGDAFIICTDGLWTEFEESEILSLVTKKVSASELAELAIKRDETDDVSVVLLWC